MLKIAFPCQSFYFETIDRKGIFKEIKKVHSCKATKESDITKKL